MIVFTRKAGEALVIGDGIEVVVVRAGKDRVKIAVRAPAHVPVHRREIYELIREENRAAAAAMARLRGGREEASCTSR
jgi:carbon storage regulator